MLFVILLIAFGAVNLNREPHLFADHVRAEIIGTEIIANYFAWRKGGGGGEEQPKSSSPPPRRQPRDGCESGEQSKSSSPSPPRHARARPGDGGAKASTSSDEQR